MTPRILVVSDEFPWPTDNGYRIRVRNVIEALAGVGDVDLFAVCDAREPDDRVLPDDAPELRLAVVDRPPLGGGPAAMGRWAVGNDPRDLAWRSWAGPAAALAAFAHGPYDLIWFSHPHSYLGLGHLTAGPTVVDFDNLESQSLAHLARNAAARGRLRRLASALDARRWERVERRVADGVDAVVVCSELDRVRLARPNAVVVPNGYSPHPARPPRPQVRSLTDGPPTGMLVGLQTYPPNADAAAWLAGEIWPLVRRSVPDATLRVVGRGGETLGLRGEGIVVTGGVAEIESELGLAHVATIPIRFGGGTRIKLLEALCHRIPVVATTVGAEGIEAVDGQHILVADDAEAFARHCVTLLTDEPTRSRLAEAGHALWQERYRWEPIRASIGALADRVARN